LIQQDDLLGGVTLLHGRAQCLTEAGWDNLLYRNQVAAAEEVDLIAIPYYAWGNRSAGEMRVWLRAK